MFGRDPSKPNSFAARGAAGWHRLGFSVLAKLVLLTSGVAVLVVLALTLYFDHRQMRELETSLRERASAYGRLLARQARSAVAFDDRETAREVLGSIAADADVVGLGLFTHGESLHVEGKLGKAAQRVGELLYEDRVYAVGDRLIAVARVASLEGPTGTLIVELSTQSLDAARRHHTRASLSFGGAILALALILTLFIARSMTRRIRAISQEAAAVAGGELEREPLLVDSTDELGDLAGSFNRMVGRLRELVKTIQDNAHEQQQRLESLVDLRTSQLAARNQALRLVMDNVEQGFLTIDRDGTMSDEHSRAIERWFGAYPAGAKLWDYLERVEKGFGTVCALGWDQVVEGFLPMEFALDQLPRRIVAGERHYALSFRPLLLDGDRFDKALVVISDVTDVVARERSEEDERETVALLGRLLEDQAWVSEFVEDGRTLVDRVEHRGLGEGDFRIAVHTLKGNASLLGLSSVTRACDEIETAIANGDPIERVDARALVKAFAGVEAKLLRFRRAFEAGAVQSFSDAAREGLLRAISSRATHAELEALVRSYTLEPVELRLKRAAEQVRALAARLGKGPVSVKVECDKLRAERSEWQALWIEIPHLLRNAVDHGLERPDQRILRGKPVEATVCLRARSSPEGMVVEVEDMGSGIDWERIEKRARELGLVRGDRVTTAALTETLFSQGISTADAVSETSGRGIGLSAVRDAVARRGGRITVESRRGRGTKFSLVWPSRSIQVDRAPSPLSVLS